MRFQAVMRRIMKNQIGKIELHHEVQTRRQLGKQPIELAVRRYGLGNFQERLVLAMQEIYFLTFDLVVPHSALTVYAERRAFKPRRPRRRSTVAARRLVIRPDECPKAGCEKKSDGVEIAQEVAKR